MKVRGREGEREGGKEERRMFGAGNVARTPFLGRLKTTTSGLGGEEIHGDLCTGQY
jgi:hypothetical protein